MYKLLSLVKRGKALINLVILKIDGISGRQVPETVAKIKNLEWCLADNISSISVKRPKKARSSMSHITR